jgi:hypothetical protein
VLKSVHDMRISDVITAAISGLAANTRPDALLMIASFNHWTDARVAVSDHARQLAAVRRRPNPPAESPAAPNISASRR